MEGITRQEECCSTRSDDKKNKRKHVMKDEQHEDYPSATIRPVPYNLPYDPSMEGHHNSSMGEHRKRGKLRNSMDLAKLSYAVLRKDRELLVIPFFEMMTIVPIMAGAFVASILNPSLAALFDDEATPTLESFLALFILVVSLTCITKFFQGALVSAAHDRMTGGDPTVISALSAAFKRITPLMGLGIAVGVINFVLGLLRNRSKSRGSSIGIGVAEIAWDYATYLSVPAVVVGSKRPIDGIKYSARLLRKTWGEQIAAQVGFGLFSFLFMIPGMAVIALGCYMILDAADVDWQSATPAIALAAAGVLWLVIVAVVFHVLDTIYKTALYIYATTGVRPTGFKENELERAFMPKSDVKAIV